MFRIEVAKTKADIAYMKDFTIKNMRRGIRVADVDSSLRKHTEIRDALKEEIKSNFGIDNVNSPKQIVECLKAMANKSVDGYKNDIVEICYDPENDKWTTNGDAMQKLSDLGYEIADFILEYRKEKKIVETLSSLAGFADKNRLVHPDVSLGKTNRINYSDPALMNIPKEMLWDLIVPYSDEDVIYSVDIKNQEPSILINFLGDETLKDALTSDKGLYETLFDKVYCPTVTMTICRDFLEENRVYSVQELKNKIYVSPSYYLPVKAPCKSMYYNDERVTVIETLCQGFKDNNSIVFPEKVKIETEAKRVYELPVEWDKNYKVKKTGDFTITGKILGVEIKLSALERKEFKTAWNALSYGASIMGIKAMCKSIDGALVYKFFNELASYKEYKKKIDGFVRKGMNSVNTVFGNMVSTHETEPKALKRALLDLPIQGTGADILSVLIKHFEEEVEKRGLKEKMFIYFTRHDELVIEVNKEFSDSTDVESILRDILEHQIILPNKEWVPFKVEVEKH